MHSKDPAVSPATPVPQGLILPLEVRVHGRGGQGGVTCAKLIAALYTQMGLSVQTFGDYGSERSGAPVQAYTRVDRSTIFNRNKVYDPNHLIVLDEGLMGTQILQGAAPGALLLLNTQKSLENFGARFAGYRFAVVDATAIAREQGIGSAAVVIINTTILGAYARVLGLPLKALKKAFAFLGLDRDLPAAQHAYEQVKIAEPSANGIAAPPAPVNVTLPPVPSELDHSKDIPATLKTGTWSNQAPVYLEHSAPCNLACPAGNDVVGFIQALKKDGVEAAAAILSRTQALPSVCGRVCPSFCMQNCNRAAFDGAVNIRGLERYIAEHQAQQLVPEKAAKPKRVAVVGGGPAGLSAAFQLAMRGHAVTIFEAGPALGGVLRNGIPAFRLPPEALNRDLARLLNLGVRSECNKRIGKAELARIVKEFDAVTVCVGFGAPVCLNVSGEDLSGVEQGLAFLDRVKRERVKLQGEVLVVGGGNTAIDCARSALRCGASSVRIVYRRAREEMPAIPEEIHDAEREGVRLLAHRVPVEFAGADAVRAALVAEVEPGPPDASGRRRPIVTDRTEIFSCEKVLLALGQRNELDLLPEGWSLEDGRAHGEHGALPVWFAGDCATGEGTVTHAIGSGRRAALAILGEALAPAHSERRVAPGQIRFSHFDVLPPRADRQFAPPGLKGNFDEVNLGLSDAGEADRCFSCGHCTKCDTCLITCPDGVIVRAGTGYRIEADYCKGCGMCVAECPRQAMEMREKQVTP